jgi:Flp pilus assembly protein TadG
MLTTRIVNRRRTGAAIVETTLILAVLALFVFGIFEYCRFLLVLHITHNAARDGARYAVVNLDKPTNFDTVNFTDGSGITRPSVRNYTIARMGNVERQLSDFRLAVYPADDVGLRLTPPVIRPKSRTDGAYPDPFNASDPNRTAWNEAAFTERIAVTVRGTYSPILPSLLLMPSSIPINLTVLAASEG